MIIKLRCAADPPLAHSACVAAGTGGVRQKVGRASQKKLGSVIIQGLTVVEHLL